MYDRSAGDCLVREQMTRVSLFRFWEERPVGQQLELPASFETESVDLRRMAERCLEVDL